VKDNQPVEPDAQRNGDLNVDSPHAPTSNDNQSTSQPGNCGGGQLIDVDPKEVR
jgi:hypothetical protein